MDTKLTTIETKIDKIDERLDKVEQVLIRNTTVMEEHHRRSNLLETHVGKIEDRFYLELGPIKNHINLVSYGFKTIVFTGGLLVGIAGLLLTLKQLGIL